jgi:hypothetical protein
MKKLALGLVVLLLLASANLAAAYSLQISPASQTVFQNDHAVINVNVTGASGIGTYDITLLFDSSILADPTVSFGSLLGAPDNSIAGPPNFALGSVEVPEVSLLFDLSSQPANFTLFTLDFLATGIGTSRIAFDSIILGDVNGVPIRDFVSTGGEITVEAGQVVVPEPGTILLMGIGLAGLAACRRKFRI